MNIISTDNCDDSSSIWHVKRAKYNVTEVGVCNILFIQNMYIQTNLNH